MEADIISRSIERILTVLISGISIYLGYRLFLTAGPAAPQGSDAQLSAGIYKFRMAKVGAGAFFALFGMVIMVVSLLSKAEVITPEKKLVYMTAAQDLIEREVVLRRIAALNRVPWNLRVDISQDEKQEILSRIAEIKAALVESIWDSAWGGAASKRQFRAWAVSGGQGAGPAGLQLAAEIFHAGGKP